MKGVPRTMGRTMLLRPALIPLVVGVVGAAWGLAALVSRDAPRAETAATIAPRPEARDIGEALVKFHDTVSGSAIAAINAAIGAEVVRAFPEQHQQWVRANGQSDRDLIRTFQLHPEVERAREAPNRMRE